jgi:hypothetical protein
MTSWIVTSTLAFFLLCTSVSSSASITKLSSEAKEYMLRTDVFSGISGVREIPASVLMKFAEIAKDPNLKIANPGEKFQATDVISEEGLPSRRLIFGGISKDYCLIHYERGGYAHSYNVILFKLSAKSADFLWGGTRFNRIRDLSELRELIRADALDDSLPYSW